MKRLLLLTLFAGMLLPLLLMAATSDNINALSDVHSTIARMPFYKDKRLEFFLTSSKVSMQGTLLTAEWPVIDVIRNEVDVETISKTPVENGMNVIYPLHSKVEDVVSFWAERPYSEGIITSESADVDQVLKVATGKEKVFFRSPTLDLNGVGFTADFTGRIVTIHSEVEIDIRSAGATALGSSLLDTSERKAEDVAEEVIKVTRAFSDTLTIDINRRVVTLSGNVRVYDDAGSITSDVLEIELGNDDKDENDSEQDETSRAIGDVKEVRFLGSVHAVRTLTDEEKADGEQQATAQFVSYMVQKDLLTLAGPPEQPPVLSRGNEYARASRIELHPKARQIEFFDNCRFEYTREEDGVKKSAPTVITTRHAVYNDMDKKITMRGDVKLFDPDQKADLRANEVDVALTKEGATRPESIYAQGGVTLERDNEGIKEKATAQKMTYLDLEKTILMEGKPELHRGDDSILGDAMLYHIEGKRLKIMKNAHIFIADAGKAAEESLPGKSDASSSLDVVSDEADLNYGGNQLLFTKNVRINGRGALLTTDLLDIALADGVKDKVPTRATATGKVHAEDESGILDTGKLEIHFIQIAGKTDVGQIYADDDVKIQSRPEVDAADGKTVLGSSGTGSTSLTAKRGQIDMIKNVADFYENVKIYDDRATLDCEHLHIVFKKADGVVPDLDSFKAKDEFPSRLAIGSDRELESITALENVVGTRKMPVGPPQYIKGSRAYYVVKNRTVEITDVLPKKPIAVSEQGGMTGEKVIIDLDTQDVFVENGDVLTHLEEKNSAKETDEEKKEKSTEK